MNQTEHEVHKNKQNAAEENHSDEILECFNASGPIIKDRVYEYLLNGRDIPNWQKNDIFISMISTCMRGRFWRQFWKLLTKMPVLWLNWPSAWHLHPVEEVYHDTVRLIEEAAPGNGLIIGITEDVPEERWQKNFTTIMDAIDNRPPI